MEGFPQVAKGNGPRRRSPTETPQELFAIHARHGIEAQVHTFSWRDECRESYCCCESGCGRAGARFDRRDERRGCGAATKLAGIGISAVHIEGSKVCFFVG